VTATMRAALIRSHGQPPGYQAGRAPHHPEESLQRAGFGRLAARWADLRADLATCLSG
jgi:hypothetical protein